MMMISEFHGSSSRQCVFFRGVAAFPISEKPLKITSRLRLQSYPAGSAQRCNSKSRLSRLIKHATDAHNGNVEHDPHATFPRIGVWNPYKRLGVSEDASEDEIQAARHYFVHKYSWHKQSVEAIESAYQQILLHKFHERRNTAGSTKKKLERSKPKNALLRAITSRFETPPKKFVLRTSITFLALAALSLLFPTEEGPTFQVAVSFLATIYFARNRHERKIRALAYGVGAFILSWLLATFLMVSGIPPLPMVRELRSFEVTTSLITYMLLWAFSTFYA